MKCLFPASRKLLYFDIMEIDADELYRRMQAIGASCADAWNEKVYSAEVGGWTGRHIRYVTMKADDDTDSSDSWVFPSLSPQNQNPCIEIDGTSGKKVPTTAEEWAELVGGIIPEYIYGMQEDVDEGWLDALSGICGDAFELEETTNPGRKIPEIDFDFTIGPGAISFPPVKEYPHKCLSCGSKAYVGFNSTDCSNSSCGNYKG